MDDHEAAQREHHLITTLLIVRDRLEPIITGEIERGHCVGTREAYCGKPGNRKTRLDDARKIAKHAAAYINQHLARYHD